MDFSEKFVFSRIYQICDFILILIVQKSYSTFDNFQDLIIFYHGEMFFKKAIQNGIVNYFPEIGWVNDSFMGVKALI